MAITTELAIGSTEASTSTISVPLNGVVTVGIYNTSGIITPGAIADVYIITPAGNRFVFQLTNGLDKEAISSVGDYIITRRSTGATFGIYSYKS